MVESIKPSSRGNRQTFHTARRSGRAFFAEVAFHYPSPGVRRSLSRNHISICGFPIFPYPVRGTGLRRQRSFLLLHHPMANRRMISSSGASRYFSHAQGIKAQLNRTNGFLTIACSKLLLMRTYFHRLPLHLYLGTLGVNKFIERPSREFNNNGEVDDWFKSRPVFCL